MGYNEHGTLGYNIQLVTLLTDGSVSGFGPSSEGDQGPPMAMVSFFPRTPTKNCIARVGWIKLSRLW